MQIPDDLTPPNESDALRLPPDAGATVAAAPGGCLEAPPSFFGQSRPFGRNADAERAGPAPAEPSEAPAGTDDRAIDN